MRGIVVHAVFTDGDDGIGRLPSLPHQEAGGYARRQALHLGGGCVVE
jgi:hypothetical protein